MALSTEEINELSNLDPFKRYEYALQKIAKTQEFYLLTNELGQIEIIELEDVDTMVIWADEEFAKQFITGDWKDCKIKKSSLKHLTSTLIPTCKKNKCQLDVFPFQDKSGLMVNADEFEKDLLGL